jgi:hypothetical protein
LPLGRLRLATRPIWTGSEPVVNTIGMVVVAAFAARAADVPATAAMTATRRLTRSAANSGSWALSFCAHRYSIVRFLPST